MNVRFFAGTKSDYLSLPSPRNPLGLYFCEDTKELFWADRLLTDGIRVVDTFADLPQLSCAAEGVVYYVTQTRNGYTLSPDRTRWLQTIYAPATDAYVVPESEIYNTVTTVGAVRDIEAKIYKTIDERIANIEVGTSGSGVKTISFAGVELLEADSGVFSIDRACARRALGFKVPEGMEDEELELVSKEYIDSQIAAIPGADLSEYAKKSELEAIETKIPSIEGLASEEFVLKKIDDKVESVNTIINNITEQVTQVTEQVSNIENNYVTNEILETNYVTNTILQENYVSNTTLEEKNFVTNTVLEENYVTSTEVNELVTNEINNVVTEQIETKVETIIQEKVDSGEIEVKVDSISYGDFEDDII